MSCVCISVFLACGNENVLAGLYVLVTTNRVCSGLVATVLVASFVSFCSDLYILLLILIRAENYAVAFIQLDINRKSNCIIICNIILFSKIC